MKLSNILSNGLKGNLDSLLQSIDYDRLFVLTDTNTLKLCMPLLDIPEGVYTKICIPAGEENKTLESLSHVWQCLSHGGASRNSLLINLGGGMVTDLGGFAAATFKRGIRFVNIPTTLLAAVDAAVGGKTGIDFFGLKNEIGAFAPAEAVIIETGFFKTLDRKNFLSGYAEILKHSLIHSVEDWKKLLAFDLEDIHYNRLSDLLIDSVRIKEKIVAEDPVEKGIRKALNLGHTIGHAMESMALESGHPVLHGYAVAWGIVCELYLSMIKTGFDKNKLVQNVRFVKERYGIFSFDCKQYDRLYELMQHDKKNASSKQINFTLLKDIGRVEINQTATREEIFESLDFYREYFC